MGTDQPATKDDLQKLDKRLIGVERDTSSLKEDVAVLKEDVAVLKENVQRIEILQEHMDGKLDAIIEILTPNLESTTLLRETVEDHEFRIDTLEKFQRATI